MDQQHNNFVSSALPASLRDLSVAAFASLGTGEWAYIRPVTVEGAAAFAVHAADGRPLAMIGTRDLAIAAVRQNELEPLSVH